MNARASASHPTHKSIHSHSHSISVLYVCVVDVRECITSVYCNSGPHTHTHWGALRMYAYMQICIRVRRHSHAHPTSTEPRRTAEDSRLIHLLTLIL